MIKKFALTLLLIFCISILAGCNTLHGFGKDIESAGETIQEATDKK